MTPWCLGGECTCADEHAKRGGIVFGTMMVLMVGLATVFILIYTLKMGWRMRFRSMRMRLSVYILTVSRRWLWPGN
jgi:hypothetical protein